MFSDKNHMNEHFDKTKHISIIQDENLDISLDEERLMRLHEDMEAAEAAGGFTY